MKMSKSLFAVVSAFLALYVLIGCATTSSGEPLGSLTITGVPAEYEGKNAGVVLYTVPKPKTQGGMNVAYSGGVTPITNGEVKLPLYKQGFGKGPGSDNLDVYLKIYESETQLRGSPDFIFQRVQFENGMAEINWDDPIKAGSITITGIPADYPSNDVAIYIGYAGSTRVVPVEVPKGSSGFYSGDTVTVSVLRVNDDEGNYHSYAETGTADIMLADSEVGIDSNNRYLFKAVQITNGKATIDFASGIKQK
jgi:hypothetical protein